MCLVTSAATHIIVCLTEANTTLQAMPKLPKAKTSPALLAREKQQAKTAKTEQAKQKKQQQAKTAKTEQAKTAKTEQAKPPKTAELPIHIPDHVPLCETCEQPYIWF